MMDAKKRIAYKHLQLLVTKVPVSNHIFTNQITVWKPMVMEA